MKFRNKITGCIEVVSKEELVEQYKKYTDVYELVDSKEVKAGKKANKKTK